MVPHTSSFMFASASASASFPLSYTASWFRYTHDISERLASWVEGGCEVLGCNHAGGVFGKRVAGCI
jgi:hypothetical protein